MDKNFNLENDKNIIAEVSGVPVNTTFGSITKPIDLLLEVIDMSADLIALIHEETELKKHHRAYGKNLQFTNLTREEAAKTTAEFLNSNNREAYSLITLFGLTAEEILEAGASYEVVKGVENLLG